MKIGFVFFIAQTLTLKCVSAELNVDSVGDSVDGSASSLATKKKKYIRSITDIIHTNGDGLVRKKINTRFSGRISSSSSQFEGNDKATVGCFSDFTRLHTITYPHGSRNSNLQCGKQCAHEGYSLSATQSDKCFCGNSMPDRVNSKVEDEKCNMICNKFQYAGCDGPEICCGGIDAYSVREVGNANVGKGILSRIATRVNSDERFQQLFRNDFEGSIHRYVSRANPCYWGVYYRKLCLRIPGAKRMAKTLADVGSCEKIGGFGEIHFMGCVEIPGIKPDECFTGDVCYEKNAKGEAFFVSYNPYRCCTLKFDINIVVNAMLATSDGNQPKQYSMRADDTTPRSESYEEKDGSGLDKLKMVGTKLNLEDLTKTDVSQPVKIENFTPVTCAPNSECEKTFTVTVKKESTLTIGTGMDLSMTVGTEISTTVGGDIPLGPSVEATASLKTEFTASTSMNVENSKTQGKEISDSTRVLVTLGKDESATIDLKRRTQDTVYGWTCTFALEGMFHLKTDYGEHKFDISTFLADRQFYTYGKWTYPDSDMFEVQITTTEGRKMSCYHKAGANTNCVE